MKREFEHLQLMLREEPTRIAEEWQVELVSQGLRAAPGEAVEIIQQLQKGLAAGGDPTRLEQSAWAGLVDVLDGLSASRAAKGDSAGNTSLFVLALKRPLFSSLQKALISQPTELVDALWAASVLVDKLAQRTVTTYQATREDIIKRQQNELLELSTPVIKLWDGILAVPMIGTLDSGRTQLVMETLLQKIVETESGLAIIDITGVPTVDTLVAQHLLKTVAAIRLMGADCIISGIRPQIAQTIVHLGIDLKGIASKATLADALQMAMAGAGYRVSRTGAAPTAVQ